MSKFLGPIIGHPRMSYMCPPESMKAHPNVHAELIRLMYRYILRYILPIGSWGLGGKAARSLHALGEDVMWQNIGITMNNRHVWACGTSPMKTIALIKPHDPKKPSSRKNVNNIGNISHHKVTTWVAGLITRNHHHHALSFCQSHRDALYGCMVLL